MKSLIREKLASARARASAAGRRAGVILIVLALGVLIVREARPAPDVGAVYQAAATNDLGAFAEQVARMPDVDARDPLGFTPLMIAASVGRVRAVELLLDRGASVDLSHRDLGTPLMLALSNGHAEVARLLLARGADVNARCGGFDPLTSAARAWAPDCLEIVLAAGAEVNRADRHDNPLTLAVREEEVDGLRRLLEAGADPNLPNADGTTPLSDAVDQHAASAALLLLAAGADPDHVGPSGLTPRSVARQLGRAEMIELATPQRTADLATGGATP